MAQLDPTTQSNYNQVSTDNVALEWLVDFETKTITGSATHTLKVKEDGPKEVMYVLSLFASELHVLSPLALIHSISRSAMS